MPTSHKPFQRKIDDRLAYIPEIDTRHNFNSRNLGLPRRLLAMETEALVIAGGLFVLSIASGMLGLGVAFAAVPFLG
ncbi:MAG TPA: hypothetical protein VNF29_08520, partial [Candidatus Binataceae bacterium]|nr:hypothetical protein [Candidatus Binataceae bacterium]